MATQGAWKGVYGADGFGLAQDPSGNNPSLPSYATVAVTGNSNNTWVDPTSDPRAPQKAAAGSTDRLAACWYSYASFTVDVNLTDGVTHQVALYALDWDNQGRTERVDVVDPANGSVLDSRTVSSFAGGQYLVYNVTGHVRFQITGVAGPNAVLSGFFFGGPPPPPTPTSTPSATPSPTVTLTTTPRPTVTPTPTPTPTTPPQTGPIAEWQFNEGSGTTTADNTGNGHTGTLVGSVSWVAGLTGVGTHALSFSSSASGYVDVPDSPSFDFTATQSFSVTAWAYVPALPGQWKAIVSKGVRGGNYYGIWISNANQWTAGQNSTITGPLATIGWHHLGLVQDGSAGRLVLYVDGVQAGSTTAQSCNGTGDFLIGSDTQAGDYFNGTIDDVRVYNRALAGTDVQNLVAAAPPGTLPFIAGPSSPATGATGVGIDPLVTAAFNEAVQASTISFLLQDPTGKTVPATLTYNASNGTVTLVPESPLAYGTTYTVILSSAQSQSGSYLSNPVSWSFTTVPDPVTTPPTVTSATPVAASTGVANTTFIAATFSEPVLKSTINFVVKDSSGNTVPGSVSYNQSDQTAIFLPSAALGNSTTYTATVSGGQNQLGVAMTSPLSWTFTTGSSTSAIASVGLTQGWATFGEVLPKGEAYTDLQVGSLTTQTDVKNWWPDGSIRYAIVTVDVPANGIYSITPASPPAGSFTPRLPNASVTFNISGTTYTASLPSTLSTDDWLSGPLVDEGRYVVVPTISSGTPHPFLQVIFDVLSYKDGATKLGVTVSNDLDQAGATAVTYNVAITANSQTLFQQANVTHYYLTNWHKSFDIGLTESTPTLDFRPWEQAGAIPTYSTQIENSDWSPTGPSFDILQCGSLNPYMPNVGGRPEIAPYPDWAARYLVYQSPEQLAYVVDNGYLAGSWPIHLQEPARGAYVGVGSLRLVSIDERPAFWFDPRAGAGNYYAGTATTPLTDGGVGIHPDNAHVPSSAYIPYLVTGSRYLSNEMAHWANWVELQTWPGGSDELGNPNARQNGGLIVEKDNQTRGIAWGLRNMADAAAYLPDSDPVKTYLATFVNNNLAWFNTYATGHTAPVGTYFEQVSNWGNAGNACVMSVWENNYVAWSIQHANDQGFSGGDLLRDAIAQWQLTLFTSSQWPEAYAAPGWILLGYYNTDGSISYISPLSAVFTANYGSPPSNPLSFSGYYGIDARLSLIMAITQGMTGAQTAFNYLMAAPGMPAYISSRAGWAIDLTTSPARSR